MKYRSRANGNIVELTDEAAANLVPAIYERIEELSPENEQAEPTEHSKRRKPR